MKIEEALLQVLQEETSVLEEWVVEVNSDMSGRRLLHTQAAELIGALRSGLTAGGDITTIEGPA